MSDLTVAQAAQRLGLDLSQSQIDQLEHYQELVLNWNKTVNLISRQDVGRFVPRHLADSLSILDLLGTGAEVIDVGSGAGLPGIPLAIAAPERKVTLVERSARKVRFLKQVVRRLGLDNAAPLNADAAEMATQASYQERFDVLVSRAVMAPQQLWTQTRMLLRPGGYMLLHVSAAESGAGPAAEQDFPELSRLQTHERLIPGLQSTHGILVLHR